MFSDITKGSETCKTNLRNFNTKLDEGESSISDTNSNIRTDEIVKNIETLQSSVNTLHDSFTTINDNIASLESDIETSKRIRQEEIAAMNAIEVEEVEDVELD